MSPRAPSIAAIRRAVCREFGIREVVLIGRRRPERICAPRHAAMYLARELTDASLNKIGREIGGRDHSTVADGVRATEIRMEFQAGFAERIGRLRRELTEASRD